jgi:hypothetical protein
VIQALEENYSGWEYPPGGGNGSWVTRNYTSARLRTLSKGDWTYGRFEARMKLPYGQGLWPAFWMLPTDGVYGEWAASGEIDIMEIIGSQPNVLHGTIHYHGEWPNNWYSGASYTLSSGDFSDDFHVFAIEWEEGEIRWYVDGIHYSTKNSWDTTSGAPFPAPFDEDFHILLNVAVGGNWPGSPDGTTVFPQRMEVDYVRVYAPSNTPPTSGVLLNPGFESGTLSPWVGRGSVANGNGGNVVSKNDLVYDHSLEANNTQGIKNPTFGNYSCKVYGAFSGSPNTTGFYQDVDALPGSVWTASVKARTEYPDQITDNNEAVVQVSFLDAANGVLAKYASRTFDTGTPINSWIDLAVTNQVYPVSGSTNKLHAPPNTDKLRFEVIFSQTLYDLGSIYFDDFSLVEQNEQNVVMPFALTASLDGGNFQISFPTQDGVGYQVRYKTGLTNETWIPIETVIGDGGTNWVSYPATNPCTFYRVLVP